MIQQHNGFSPTEIKCFIAEDQTISKICGEFCAGKVLHHKMMTQDQKSGSKYSSAI